MIFTKIIPRPINVAHLVQNVQSAHHAHPVHIPLVSPLTLLYLSRVNSDPG
jgi:hypothetical protein